MAANCWLAVHATPHGPLLQRGVGAAPGATRLCRRRCARGGSRRAQHAARARGVRPRLLVVAAAAAAVRWLRRPDSLQLLLQRPLWMDAWRRGEEERAVLLWAKLPDNIMNTILDLLEQQRLAAKASRLPRKWARSFRAYERGRRRGSLEPGFTRLGCMWPRARAKQLVLPACLRIRVCQM